MCLLNRRFILLLAAALLSGCGSTGNKKTISPIDMVTPNARKTLEVLGGEPVAVRLTQPASVLGIALPAGSIMRQTSKNQCRLFPSEMIMFGHFSIPAASEIELALRGAGYVWNGKVTLGEAVTYLGMNLETGDGVFFAGNTPSASLVSQIKLGTPREFAGQWYPAGTVLYVDAAGALTGVTAPVPPDVLSAQQASYWKQKAEHHSRCEEICAAHKEDVAAHSGCMEYCLGR